MRWHWLSFSLPCASAFGGVCHFLFFPLLLLILNIPLALKCFTVFEVKWRNKLQTYSGANSFLAGVCSSSGLWSVLERRTGRQRSLSYATNDKRIRKGCLHFFIFIWILFISLDKYQIYLSMVNSFHLILIIFAPSSLSCVFPTSGPFFLRSLPLRFFS